ncbi:MAG: efflux RND transporter permease subunit [Maricaulaceae bacterium]|nr:efflux RND transporter permease subunit [Maricaulaceae bacterium]
MVVLPDQDRPRGLIGWWASNAVAANLLMAICFIGGVIGFLQMNREVFPTFAVNGASITMSWPGASPQEVEEQIVLRIEEAVASIPGVERITSTAREGFGAVNIQGRRNVDMTAFIDEIKMRVDSINNMPPSAFRPVVQQWRAQDQMAGFAIHGDIDRRELQRIAREIRNEVAAQVPGASMAQLWATLNEEVSIEPSETEMRRYGLTFDELARAIRTSSLNASAGSVRTEIGDVALTSRQLADTAAQFEQIIVRQTRDGGTIRLGDVARITDGFVDANLYATFDGELMALIVIPTMEGQNVVQTSRALEQYIERKQRALPEGVTISMWWDSSELYHQRMGTITNSAGLGLLLVLLVLVLFLRPIVAFWVTVGIATAFAGSLLVLPLLGVSLNMLSMFAFLLVIGIIVDDAIIVGENIHNRVERGEKGLTAAVIGAQMVAKPVVFAVITSMMVFAPWMMLSGPEVQFTRQISLVVVAALSFSLIESLLILPAHLAHIKPQNPKGFSAPLIRAQRVLGESLIWFARNIYRPVIVLALRRRYSTLVTFIGLFAIAIVLMQTNRVGWSFMPEVENETIQIDIQMAEGTPWSRTEQVRQRLEEAEHEVQLAYREEYPGQPDMIESRSTIATNGRVRAWVNIANPQERPGRLPTRVVAQRIRDALGPIPDAQEIRFDVNINQGGPGVQLAISHPDLDVLRAAAEDLKAQLRSYDTLYDVIDNLQSSTDELQFEPRPDAQALGLTLADVTRQVRQAFYGEEVMRLPREGQDVRVMVRYPYEQRHSLDTLRDFRIRTADGREVPLSAVAEAEFAPGLARINRRNRMRTVTVSASLSDPGVRGEIMQDLNQNFFPDWQARHPGVVRELTGQAEGEMEFIAEVGTLLLGVLVAMYVLLAIAFRSYAQPILIMSAIPFALAGAIFGHLAFGMSLTLFSLFGVGAAAGVVINDNLVLMDFVNRLRRSGVGAFQSLVDAAVQRFRPILLTSVTTFLGILPMMAERSTQAQFLKPMVVALGFAVVFALFLTLLLVPALYAIGVDIKRLVVSLWRGEKQPGIGSTYHETETGEPDIDVATVKPAE